MDPMLSPYVNSDDSSMTYPMDLAAVHPLLLDHTQNHVVAPAHSVPWTRMAHLEHRVSRIEQSARGLDCSPYPNLDADADHDTTYHVRGILGDETDLYVQPSGGDRYASSLAPVCADLTSNTESEERSPSPLASLAQLNCYALPFLDGGYSLDPQMPNCDFDCGGSVEPRAVQMFADTEPDYGDPQSLVQKGVVQIYPCPLPYHPAEGTDYDVDDHEADGEFEPICDHVIESETTHQTAIMPAKKIIPRAPRKTVVNPSSHRVRKRGVPRNTVPKPKPRSSSKNGTGGRMFVCSFKAYGCDSTFPSKNEWKRHVMSQHMKLGFYRCDIGQCNISTVPGGSLTGSGSRHPNDFNRKDLFTQHLRRMHLPWPGKTAPSKQAAEEFENGLSVHWDRCWMKNRAPPQQSRCGICQTCFDSWEDRMEHVGKHYEKQEFSEEAEDPDLVQWALREGVLCEEGEPKQLILASKLGYDS